MLSACNCVPSVTSDMVLATHLNHSLNRSWYGVDYHESTNKRSLQVRGSVENHDFVSILVQKDTILADGIWQQPILGVTKCSALTHAKQNTSTPLSVSSAEGL
ncbi:hypothetical protein ACA910_018043 [Epithemia clementina (nom. ined.)]